jgi:hypothetical protein
MSKSRTDCNGFAFDGGGVAKFTICLSIFLVFDCLDDALDDAGLVFFFVGEGMARRGRVPVRVVVVTGGEKDTLGLECMI